MKKVTLLITIVCAVILTSQMAFAEDVLTVTKTENINGSIGLYIKNHLTTTVRTNPDKYNTNVLTYFVEGVNTSIIEGKSTKTIKPNEEKLVVLDKAWPTSDHYKIEILFTDDAGVKYPKETSKVFAKPGLSLKKVEITPDTIFSNSTFTIKFLIKADGDKGVSSIGVESSNPKYFIFDSKEVPSYMNLGDEKEFIFKFNSSGATMPPTVIYSTSYVLVNVSYKYYNWTSTLDLNSSIVVFNPANVKNELPRVSVRIDSPPTVKRDSKTNISVYVWNKNLGGHASCDLNLSLSVNSTAVKLPVHTILPGIRVNGTASEPDEPAATFTLETTNSTPLGYYELTLITNYKDCLWKSSHNVENRVIFEVIKIEEIKINKTKINETKANETTNITVNQTNKIENISKENKTEEPPKETKEEVEVAWIGSLSFYMAMTIIAFLTVIVVIYILIIRSQYI